MTHRDSPGTASPRPHTIYEACRRTSTPPLLLAATLLAIGCGSDNGPIDPPPEPPNPVPGIPAAVDIVAGNDQRAVQGLSLLDSLVVRVSDAEGNPIAGHTVTFAASAGHGSASPAASTTDDGGRAAASWTLGPPSGTQTLAVGAATISATVTATALDLEAELDTLFVPAADAEIATVLADWATRDISVADARVEFSEPIDMGGSAAELQVVSHVVAGARHYGAILTPTGKEPRSLPVLAYLHGGDSGVGLDVVQVAATALGDLRDRFVFVIPSYRSEPLEHGDLSWTSEGISSPWDYDVDDALALINVAVETVPEAKPDSFNVLGVSRGAGVALLAGVRDDRIARVVAFFGPTDFFDSWVRELVREAALRDPRDLPGVAHLDSTLVQPYIMGHVSRAQARVELARRSSVLYAARLPSVQLHHGEVDDVVSVSQAHSLIAAMDALGRGPPDFEPYIYGDGDHGFGTLAVGLVRAAEFLGRSLGDDNAR